MSTGKGIGKANKDLFSTFVEDNIVSVEDAKGLGLPTSLVERRKRRSAKMYVDDGYFQFMCLVESTYDEGICRWRSCT